MSSTAFTDLVAGASVQQGALHVDITADWMQGRTTYGGLSTALCLETVLRSASDLPPLRSANVAFVGPAGGPVAGRARELRRGKSVSFFEVDLTGEKGLATRCSFAFGADRESTLSQTWTPEPDVPRPEACPVFIPEGFGPHFTQHFDTRLARGARPGSGSSEHDHFIWVRHRDAAANDLVALIALADMPPPAVLPMAAEFAPISSMTWMFNVLTREPQTEQGWWLLQTRAEQAAGGYSSQDMLVRNADLELVIAGRQSVAIFF